MATALFDCYRFWRSAAAIHMTLLMSQNFDDGQ
jgi:hypothetical protein